MHRCCWGPACHASLLPACSPWKQLRYPARDSAAVLGVVLGALDGTTHVIYRSLLLISTQNSQLFAKNRRTTCSDARMQDARISQAVGADARKAHLLTIGVQVNNRAYAGWCYLGHESGNSGLCKEWPHYHIISASSGSVLHVSAWIAVCNQRSE